MLAHVVFDDFEGASELLVWTRHEKVSWLLSRVPAGDSRWYGFPSAAQRIGSFSFCGIIDEIFQGKMTLWLLVVFNILTSDEQCLRIRMIRIVDQIINIVTNLNR